MINRLADQLQSRVGKKYIWIISLTLLKISWELFSICVWIFDCLSKNATVRVCSAVRQISLNTEGWVRRQVIDCWQRQSRGKDLISTWDTSNHLGHCQQAKTHFHWTKLPSDPDETEQGKNAGHPGKHYLQSMGLHFFKEFIWVV